MSASPHTYLVECFWPGVTERALTAAAQRVADDDSVVCQEVILVAVDEIVLGLFQAHSEAAIADATRRAGLPCERIVDAVRIDRSARHTTAPGAAPQSRGRH